MPPPLSHLEGDYRQGHSDVGVWEVGLTPSGSVSGFYLWRLWAWGTWAEGRGTGVLTSQEEMSRLWLSF